MASSGRTRPGVDDTPKQRVVVLGGGFAGVYTARHLGKLLGRRRDVHVELLSQENYFVFQPLLPEVAAGGIHPNHVVNPIREIVPRAQFRWCRVVEIDCNRKVVLVLQGEARELVEVPYDHLVFGLGKVSNFSSMPGVSEHGLAMKDLSDAFRLRNHVFRCLELADVETNPEEKRALLTFVVAGGGFSGVETAGELSELLHRSLEWFRNVSLSEVRLVVVHSSDQLLPEMHAALGRSAERILRKRNVELILNARVRAASRHAVYVSVAGQSQALYTRTFICTVGNGPNPVVKDTLTRWGFEEGRIGERKVGVFATDVELRCVGKDGYWAVGDTAGVPDTTQGGAMCPATAQYAIRQAAVCARNILNAIDRKPLVQFRFKSLGMLASLGNRSAVADMMGVRFSGFLAWFAWRTVYLSKLPGFLRKLRVAIDWTIDLFFPRDITQIQTIRGDRLRVDHYEAGEAIITKGEIGRELFIVKSGEIEVFDTEREADRQVIAVMGKGECFGEKALLMDAPRTASVRAKTSVDVLVISRGDFQEMVAQFPVLDDHFDAIMHRRYPELLDPEARLAQSVGRPVVLPR
jgi:NADH:ubiquinone reductase (H+-translocating)